MISVSTEFYWIAVVAVTIVSIARITRLLTIDKFPPIKKVRDRYEERTEGSGWEWLTICGYCMAPWVTLPVLGTGIAADVYGGPASRPEDAWYFLAWWIVNGWLAVAYLAAIVMANDGDKSED